MDNLSFTQLAAQDTGVLRLITAGSVDDGKSTLIGRLLYDSKGVYADQLQAIARSKYQRNEGEGPDLALLTDGLQAEREQGITIDVAYRYFATPKRKFIVADAPGHEQYTRNMVTGASTAQAAIILIDAVQAQNGELPVQTRRHSALAQLLGIRHIIIAVNKMDRLGWDESAFRRIHAAYGELARQLGLDAYHAVPISALHGDNVVHAGTHAPWYRGPTLLTLLEALPLSVQTDALPARMFVQWVIRHGGQGDNDLRGYAGQVASGRLRVGDSIQVLPSGQHARIARLLAFDREQDQAVAGDSVTVVLDRDLDVSRGDLLAAADARVRVGQAFEAHLCWLDEQALNPARPYWLKQGTRLTQARIKAIHARRDMRSMAHVASTDPLKMNDIGRVSIATRERLVLDAYEHLPVTGAFILIDTATHQTAAAGMVL